MVRNFENSVPSVNQQMTDSNENVFDSVEDSFKDSLKFTIFNSLEIGSRQKDNS